MARHPNQQQVVIAVLVALLVVFAAGTAPARVSGAVSCAQVVRDLTPCISYAMGAAPGASAGAPGPVCCNGIKSLNAAAGTVADRQATCACIKQVTASMGALKPDLVAAIPGLCGVAVPYPISRTTDCSKVQ